MKFLCKNWIIIAAVCGANLAHAQLPYFENFDAMRADSFDWASQERLIWSEFEYGPDESPSRIRGPRDGVTPFSGNRMFEMRSSVYKGRERTMQIPTSGFNSGSNPSVELSLKFYVPSAYASSNKIIFEARGSGMRTGRFIFDLSTSTFQFRSFAIDDHSKSFAFTVPRDRWNTIRIRTSWADDQIRSSFNEVPLLQVPFEEDGAAKLNFVRFGVDPLQSTLDQYAPLDGAPGYFVDDVRLGAVPEPSSACVIIAGVAVSAACTRRRRT